MLDGAWRSAAAMDRRRCSRGRGRLLRGNATDHVTLPCLAPFLQALHYDEERRHKQDGEQRRCQHAGENGDADRLARARASACGEHQGQNAENESERGHNDRPEPRTGRLDRGFHDGPSLMTELARDLDDKNGVLGRYARSPGSSVGILRSFLLVQQAAVLKRHPGRPRSPSRGRRRQRAAHFRESINQDGG